MTRPASNGARAGNSLGISKRIQYRTEWVLTHALIGVCSVVPLAVLRRFGAGLGWAAWRILRARRRVVIENISRSFPGFDASAVDAVAVEACRQYGMALVEFAAFRSLSRRRLLGMVDVEGRENLDAALGGGDGAILFTGHFGNWELLGAVVAACGYPLYVTDTNHSNELTHEIISSLRIRQGMKIIAPSEPFTRIASLLSANNFVAYLADQDARRHGIFVDFFGRPASTVRGPALFSVRKGCPIVPLFLVREGRDRHRAIFEKPLRPDPRLKGSEAIHEITQRFTTLLETYVREYPGHYFWMHRRWKTTPHNASLQANAPEENAPQENARG
jgi:KDO2-lipid IV(A) lauroyltransferase